MNRFIMLSPTSESLLFEDIKEDNCDDILKELNMDLFSSVQLDDPNMGWLTADNFEFSPFKKVENDVELDSGFLGSPLGSEGNSSGESNADSMFWIDLPDVSVNKQQSSDKRRRNKRTSSQRSNGSSDVSTRRKRSAPSGCNQQSEDEDEGQPLTMNADGGLSKNAIAARENRIRKKRYIEGLEKSVTSLGAENIDLKRKTEDLEDMVEKMSDEITYLRNVLSNVDEVSSLVESIRSVNNKSKQDNMCKGFINQHDYSKACLVSPHLDSATVNKRTESGYGEDRFGKRIKIEGHKASLGGVCIHVNKGQMSLEFCPRCSGNANATWAMQSTDKLKC